VGGAAPDVDDLLAVDVQTEGGSDLAVVLEVDPEGLLDAFVSRCDVSVAVGHVSSRRASAVRRPAARGGRWSSCAPRRGRRPGAGCGLACTWRPAGSRR